VIKYPKGARVAIMKKGDHYDSFNLTGESYNVEFIRSDVAGVYVYKNYFKETDSYSKASAVISKNGRMEFSYEFPINTSALSSTTATKKAPRLSTTPSWSRVFPEEKKKK
jgi:hypothetical protein